jgi:hypothetical protein
VVNDPHIEMPQTPKLWIAVKGKDLAKRDKPTLVSVMDAFWPRDRARARDA